MTTHKKMTHDEKHKVVAHKSPKPTPGQTMDIIPKNRIRPSTTSRPVIDSGPRVVDNSMMGPTSAPTLRVKRHNLTIDPSKDSDLTKDDVSPNTATGHREDHESHADVKSQGVSVEELIAKRTGGERVITPSESPDKSEESNEPDETSMTPEIPTGAVSGDEKAAVEAARLLSHPPHTSITDLEATRSSTRHPNAEPSPSDETATEPLIANDTPEGLTQTSHQVAKGEEQSQEPSDNGDSLADALREEPSETQEHSQALKDAMKEMGEKSEAERGKLKEDGHHELYGGKPVIVIHKDHGHMSPVAWVLWFIFCLMLALLIVNFLLDAGYIETDYQVPHTELISE